MNRALTWLGLVFMVSCTKTELVQAPPPEREICFDCGSLSQAYKDSIEHPTILGATEANPYRIANMARAYEIVYHKPAGKLPVTHRYIRFSPADMEALDRLESSGLELFDYPLDRALISEGDYFPQPGKGEEDIPEYYAVVESGQDIPSGIKATVLDEMHIPDNDPAWENEALRLANDLQDPDLIGPKTDNEHNDQPTYAEAGHYPSGRIQLRKKLLTDNGVMPIADLRVVIRRGLKVERLQTNAWGEFFGKKYFRNKYTILARFTNNQAQVSRSRPRRIFEQFFPVKVNFGKWDHLNRMHQFVIEHPGQAGNIAASYWCAGMVIVSLKQFHEYSATDGITAPPKGLHIMLSSKKSSGHGNTYMLQEIMEDNTAKIIAGEAILVAVASTLNPVTGLAILATTAFLSRRAPDITYGYGGDPSFLQTDRYAELVMHELAHAGHYQKTGAVWWARFGVAEATNEGEGSYGQCCTKYAPVIALAESWAYSLGHLYADRSYGLQSTAFPEQGWIDEQRNIITFSNQKGVSSHIYFLEAFDPRKADDPNRWVPKGLIYDLLDGEGELFPASRVVDEVSGFSLRQVSGQLGKEIHDIHQLRDRLIAVYGQGKEAGIRRLFMQYGY